MAILRIVYRDGETETYNSENVDWRIDLINRTIVIENERHKRTIMLDFVKFFEEWR